MSVFAIMVIPAQVEAGPSGPQFWGMGSTVLFDATGNEVFAQSVHNIVVDEGEEFIITQVFQQNTNPAVVADNISIGSICITDDLTPTIADGHTAAQFDTDNLIDTGLACIEDTSITVAGDGKAVIGPLTFGTGNLDAADETIGAIGICVAAAADDTHILCAANGGILFATIAVSNTQLGTGETVQISYTFDISAA